MESRKGQGATEYLVLLAVVLIIALVAIALLGFFPALSGDARITQSDSYWRGTARPIQIKDHAQSGDTLKLVMFNSEAEAISVNSITVDNSTYSATNLTFAGGEQISGVNVTGLPICTAGSGLTYEYKVSINYTTSNDLVKTETGTKTLIGKC